MPETSKLVIEEDGGLAPFAEEGSEENSSLSLSRRSGSISRRDDDDSVRAEEHSVSRLQLSDVHLEPKQHRVMTKQQKEAAEKKKKEDNEKARKAKLAIQKEKEKALKAKADSEIASQKAQKAAEKAAKAMAEAQKLILEANAASMKAHEADQKAREAEEHENSQSDNARNEISSNADSKSKRKSSLLGMGTSASLEKIDGETTVDPKVEKARLKAEKSAQEHAVKETKRKAKEEAEEKRQKEEAIVKQAKKQAKAEAAKKEQAEKEAKKLAKQQAGGVKTDATPEAVAAKALKKAEKIRLEHEKEAQRLAAKKLKKEQQAKEAEEKAALDEERQSLRHGVKTKSIQKLPDGAEDVGTLDEIEPRSEGSVDGGIKLTKEEEEKKKVEEEKSKKFPRKFKIDLGKRPSVAPSRSTSAVDMRLRDVIETVNHTGESLSPSAAVRERDEKKSVFSGLFKSDKKADGDTAEVRRKETLKTNDLAALEAAALLAGSKAATEQEAADNASEAKTDAKEDKASKKAAKEKEEVVKRARKAATKLKEEAEKQRKKNLEAKTESPDTPQFRGTIPISSSSTEGTDSALSLPKKREEKKNSVFRRKPGAITLPKMPAAPRPRPSITLPAAMAPAAADERAVLGFSLDGAVSFTSPSVTTPVAAVSSGSWVGRAFGRAFRAKKFSATLPRQFAANFTPSVTTTPVSTTSATLSTPNLNSATTSSLTDDTTTTTTSATTPIAVASVAATVTRRATVNSVSPIKIVPPPLQTTTTTSTSPSHNRPSSTPATTPTSTVPTPVAIPSPHGAASKATPPPITVTPSSSDHIPVPSPASFHSRSTDIVSPQHRQDSPSSQSFSDRQNHDWEAALNVKQIKESRSLFFDAGSGFDPDLPLPSGRTTTMQLMMEQNKASIPLSQRAFYVPSMRGMFAQPVPLNFADEGGVEDWESALNEKVAANDWETNLQQQAV